MKELFIVLSFYILIFVLHGIEATREGSKWSKDRRQEQHAATVKWKRNLAHKPKHNKRLKLTASREKNDASQRKRQFVPEIPFLNFPHPHIHRIIVHHHPGRSMGFGTLRCEGSRLVSSVNKGVKEKKVFLKYRWHKKEHLLQLNGKLSSIRTLALKFVNCMKKENLFIN